MGIEPVIAPPGAPVSFPSHCPCAFVATWEWNFTHSIYWTLTRFTLSIIYSSQQLYMLSGILLILKWSLKKLSFLSRVPRGFPGGAVVKESTSHAGDVGLIPEWERSPRGGWQPTPVLLLGKSHGQRSLAAYSPWGHKESNSTEHLWWNFNHPTVGSSLNCTLNKKLKEAKIIRRNLFNRQKFFPFKILCLLDRYYSWKN